jgi:vacuolar-type H+-ATPase subunit E/Vma4
VQLAKEKADQMVERDALAVQAQSRAEQILQSAKAEAEGIRADADDYALDVLTRLETELTKSLNQVRNGVAKLRADKGLPVTPGSD